MMRRLRNYSRQGISLLETVVVLLVASVALRGLFMAIDARADEQLRVAAANQLTEVVSAAREHIQTKEKYVELLSHPSIASGVDVTDFKVMGQPLFEVRNIYQNRYEVRVRGYNNAFGQRQLVAAVHTVGGEVLDREDGNAIARLAGARAGFVAGGLLEGPAAELNINLADFGSFPNGSLFSLVLLSQSGDYNSDGLFREAVAGRPDLNTAQTDIDMNKNNLRNALNTQARSIEVQDVAGGESIASREISIASADIERTNADLLEAQTVTTQNIYVTQGLGGRNNGLNQGSLTGSGNASVDGETHVHGKSNGKTNVHGTTSPQTIAMIEGLNTREGSITTGGGDAYAHHVQATGVVRVANTGKFIPPVAEILTPCLNDGAVAQDGEKVLICRGGIWSSNIRRTWLDIWNEPYPNLSPTGPAYDHIATANTWFPGYYRKEMISGSWASCFLSGYRSPSEPGSTQYGAYASSTRQVVRTERSGCCGGGGPDDLYAETSSAVTVNFISSYRSAGDSTCYVGREASGQWYLMMEQNNFVNEEQWCVALCIK